MTESTVSSTTRGLSKLIFGNSYMLEVCVKVQEAGSRTNLSLLVGDSGVSPSLYSVPVHRLVEAGFLIPDPQAGDDRRERWYRPRRSTLWKIAKDLTA